MTDLIKRDDALLPCPFCGGDKNTICRTDYDGRDAYAVSCRYHNCHGAIFMLGYGYFATKEEAMAAWNERGPLTPEPDEVEKPQPITPEEVFMEAVWDALKADTSDLGKQARILAAFRAATPAVDIAQLTAEVAKFVPAHDAAIREAALREAMDAIADYPRVAPDEIEAQHYDEQIAHCQSILLHLIEKGAADGLV